MHYSSSFFFYSILRWSVAVSTMRRQSSRILQADARPMFCWPRSASTARSQVWLGLPNGRFQSRGNPGSPQRQHGAWWSSCGELRAIMQYVSSRKRLSVTKWERGRHPVVALTSSFVTWRVYGILRILRSAHIRYILPGCHNVQVALRPFPLCTAQKFQQVSGKDQSIRRGIRHRRQSVRTVVPA